MRRNFIFAAMALLLTVLITFAFRIPLSLAVAKYYLPQGQFTCLNWALSGLKEITVDEVCFENDVIFLKGKNIILTAQHIKVGVLRVDHKGQQESSQNNTMHKLDLPLPERRPLLNVDQLNIHSPTLNQTLKLSVKETRLNEFVVTGDLMAQLEILTDKLTVQLGLDSKAVEHYLPEQVEKLAGNLNLSTDGVSIEYNTNIDLNARHQKNTLCPIKFSANGQVTGNWHLNNKRGEVNPSKLPIHVDVSGCADFTNAQARLPDGGIGGQWQAVFDSGIEVSQSKVVLPKITLLDSDNDSEVQIQSFSLKLNSRIAKGRLSVNHQTAALGLVALQSSFLYKPQALTISGDWIVSNELLELPDNLFFKELVSQGAFNLAGDSLRALTIDLNSQVTASEINVHDTQLDNAEFNVKATSVIHLDKFGQEENWPIQIKDLTTQLSAQRYKLQALSGKYVLLQAQAKLSEFGELTANTELDIGSFKMRDIRGKGINQISTISGKVTNSEYTAKVDGEMHLGLVANPNLSFRDAVLTTSGSIQDAVKLNHIAHLEDFEFSIDHILDGELNQMLIKVPEQSFMTLQPFVSQLAPQLQLSEGLISAEVTGNLSTQSYQFKADLQGGGVLYDSHYLNGINLPVIGKFDEGQLVLSETVLDIAEVRSGAVLTDLSAKLSSTNNTLILNDTKATIFDGEISAQQINLSSGDQNFSIEAHNWDLAHVSEAGKSAGVELRGRVSGQLPVTIKQGDIEITNGKLTNIDVGLLRIDNNESVEALKSHQAGIDTAFSLLENLEIEKLSSDVALSPDGWLDLAVEIAGVNEQAKQPINFNYTHSENIFQLFRALRLSDEITNEVEKALNK
ncbi:intermembrane phospholipid transport protein YdbH family protein [Pseudoalteromonas luteoviolacea]|uniref:Uncharacterized protein n=1 Tax=Pseudoalteromonas luteoviolacea NCIMB 1942 TaxID=1365253 RepID=A0A167D491_9GAMM|nr:YdbH domain-containing protein [Pseudoalteromonas luteoviolacea]KZN48398.1 hypothetical protein N482_07980 [Pseudoalteromonas luteoviolacea NCIMB 1942]